MSRIEVEYWGGLHDGLTEKIHPNDAGMLAKTITRIDGNLNWTYALECNDKGKPVRAPARYSFLAVAPRNQETTP